MNLSIEIRIIDASIPTDHRKYDDQGKHIGNMSEAEIASEKASLEGKIFLRAHVMDKGSSLRTSLESPVGFPGEEIWLRMQLMEVIAKCTGSLPAEFKPEMLRKESK